MFTSEIIWLFVKLTCVMVAFILFTYFVSDVLFVWLFDWLEKYEPDTSKVRLWEKIYCILYVFTHPNMDKGKSADRREVSTK